MYTFDAWTLDTFAFFISLCILLYQKAIKGEQRIEEREEVKYLCSHPQGAKTVIRFEKFAFTLQHSQRQGQALRGKVLLCDYVMMDSHCFIMSCRCMFISVLGEV